MCMPIWGTCLGYIAKSRRLSTRALVRKDCNVVSEHPKEEMQYTNWRHCLTTTRREPWLCVVRKTTNGRNLCGSRLRARAREGNTRSACLCMSPGTKTGWNNTCAPMLEILAMAKNAPGWVVWGKEGSVTLGDGHLGASVT